MSGRNVLKILFFYFSLMINYYGQSALPEDDLDYGANRLNLNSFNLSAENYIAGDEIINEYDGNFLTHYQINRKIQNNLSVNLSLYFNSNVEHRVFRVEHQPMAYNQEGYMVNLPEWIIGINGIATQTLNFENNFFMGQQDYLGHINWNGDGEGNPLKGEEVPFLIPGYSYTNKISNGTNVGGKYSFDYIEILLADGSKKLLSNTELNKFDGLYIGPQKTDLGYAIVKYINGIDGLREIWFHPGDGLTYYFIEENVNYYNYLQEARINNPRVMYLKKIISSNGSYLSLSYNEPLCVNGSTLYGRKIFSGVRYVAYNNSYSYPIANIELTTFNGDLKTVNLRSSEKNLLCTIINQTGSGIMSIDKSSNINHSKIKYIGSIEDGENNISTYNYTQDLHGSRGYKYFSNTSGLYQFYFNHPLYLLNEIEYFNGKKTSINYYNSPYPYNTEDCLTYYFIDFALAGYKGNSCNRLYALRDNQTVYMIKDRTIGDQNEDILKENYTYTYTYLGEYPKTTEIYTNVAYDNLKTSDNSSPEIIKEYNFTKFNVLQYQEGFASNNLPEKYTSIVKLTKETIFENNNNNMRTIYNYDINAISGFIYCTLGNFQLSSKVEEFRVGSSFKSQTSSYNYQFTTSNLGKNIITNKTIVDSKGLSTSMSYHTQFMDISTTIENNYYNLSQVENIYTEGSDQKLGTKKVYDFYGENEAEGEGKIKYIKKYDVTDQSRFKTINYFYEVDDKVSKGFIKIITNDNGLEINYSYADAKPTDPQYLVFEPVDCKLVRYDGLIKNDDPFDSWDKPFLSEPFMVEKEFSGKSLTNYHYRILNEEILIDENEYFYFSTFDNLGRTKSISKPGSWYDLTTGWPIVLDFTNPSIEIEYNDVDRTMITSKLFECDPNNLLGLTEKIEFDYFGKTTKSSIRNSNEDYILKDNLEYNYLSLISSRTNGMGVKKEYTYDFLNREVTANFTGYPSQEISYTYDFDDEVITYEDEVGKKTTKWYDNLGNLYKEQLGEGSPFTIYEYNSLNQIIEITSPESKEITYEYDGFGNISERTSPDEGTYKYKYDKWGNLRFVYHTTSNGEVVFNNYDALNRRLSTGICTLEEFSPALFAMEGWETVWEWLDPDINYALENDTDNWVINNMYDNFTRSGVFSDLPSKTTAQITDMNIKSRLSATAYRNESTDNWNLKYYEYDHLGRIAKQNNKLYSGTWKYISYQYDHLNNLLVQNINDQHFVWNEFDTQSRLTIVKSNHINDVNNAIVEAEYQYNNADQIAVIGTEGYEDVLDNTTISDTENHEAPLVVANSVTVTSSGNLTLKGGAGVTLNSGFSVNLGGELHAIIDQTIGTGSAFGATSYNYNDRGWIENIKNNSGAVFERFDENLTYADNGNVESQTIANKGNGDWEVFDFNYLYDSMNRLTNANCSEIDFTESFSYDNDGNFLSKNNSNANYTYNYFSGTNKINSISGYYSYLFDSKGNLTTKKNSAGSNIFTANNYDYRNLALSVWETSAGTTTYRYDDGGNRVVKKVGDGSVTNEYYLRDQNGIEVAIYDITTDNIKQVNIFGNGIVGYIKKGSADERFYYVKDHLGSVRLTIDENSEIVSAKDYFAYGEVLRSVNFGEEDKYDFTEKERDVETGLNYFGARYYDSDIGRWTSVDPLAGRYPGWSPYNYVKNNPLRLVDLYGLNPDDPPEMQHTLEEIVVTANRPTQSYVLPLWIGTGWSIALGEPTPIGEIVMGVGTGAYLTYSLLNTLNNEETENEADDKEHTPETHPEEFENVRKSKAKKHKESGEIWEKDQLHKDHWEIYKNKKLWENGVRSRNVWDNGTYKPLK